MGETNTSMSDDGYADADGEGRCFISFDGISMNFKNVTGYSSNNYGDFADRFYYYALDGFHSINDALDAATQDTHDPQTHDDYSDCQLYTG